MKTETRRALGLSLAVLVGLIFILFGLSKLQNPAQLAQAIRNYKWDFLPVWFIRFSAVVLPWWELAAGGAIMVTSWRREAAWMIGGMTTLFAVAVGSAIYRNLDIECGCFDGGAKVGFTTLGLEVGILFAIGVILWCCQVANDSPEIEQQD